MFAFTCSDTYVVMQEDGLILNQTDEEENTFVNNVAKYEGWGQSLIAAIKLGWDFIF